MRKNSLNWAFCSLFCLSFHAFANESLPAPESQDNIQNTEQIASEPEEILESKEHSLFRVGPQMSFSFPLFWNLGFLVEASENWNVSVGGGFFKRTASNTSVLTAGNSIENVQLDSSHVALGVSYLPFVNESNSLQYVKTSVLFGRQWFSAYQSGKTSAGYARAEEVRNGWFFGLALGAQFEPFSNLMVASQIGFIRLMSVRSEDRFKVYGNLSEAQKAEVSNAAEVREMRQKTKTQAERFGQGFLPYIEILQMSYLF
jgi:hypothetical protein